MNPCGVSIIIIAKNEEKRIKTAVESVINADEILVIDNGSIDATGKIARDLGCRVINNRSTDFATLRNIGCAEAKYSWLFYLDADETVTADLFAGIKAVCSKQYKTVKNEFSAYYITRRNYYLGHEWPVKERIIRLIYKPVLKRWQGEIHETALVSGKIGDLKGEIVHRTHRNIAEMVAKTNEWSETESELRLKTGHPKMAVWRFIRVMISAFMDSYIRQRGWKVGIIGVIESVYQSFSIFITYAKLWEKQQI